jgi:hypothetical protein
MTTKEEIEQFLAEFKVKLGIWGILFRDDRGKNTQTLLDIEIKSADREKVLKELKTENYSEGPLEEKLYGGANMWVFGKLIKNKEVYIKITMGLKGAQVICISFHVAEHSMKYPYKIPTL